MVLCARQAAACAWLGHWYREVAQNMFKARNCYRRALALDPTDTVVGARFVLHTFDIPGWNQHSGMAPQPVCWSNLTS